jgi:hypothetical protein
MGGTMMKATLLFHAALLFAAAANACDQPPFSERYENHGTATWTQGDGGCELRSTLVANDVTAAGVAHFQRRDGSSPLHLSFRLDLSELTSVNAIQSVSIAAATSKAAVPSGDRTSADLFRLTVLGNIQGTSRQLGIVAACTSAPGGLCTAIAPITNDNPHIGLRLTIGAGNGSLQVWIDDDFEGAPTVSLQGIDNAALGAIERVVLGLNSASQAFLATHVGETVTFGQVAMRLVHPIQVVDANGTGAGDDQLFHVDFESVGAPGCGDDALPIPLGSTVVGTTCGGTHVLPTLASGSTSGYAPERLFVFSQPEPRDRTFQVNSELAPAMAVFVCSRQCGPSARCVGGAATAPLAISQLPAGEHIVVVKTLGPADLCGEFDLDIFGPLD